MQKSWLLTDDTWQIADVFPQRRAGIASELLDNGIERHTIVCTLVTTDGQKRQQRDIGNATALRKLTSVIPRHMKTEEAQPTGRTGLPAGPVALATRPVNQSYGAGTYWTGTANPEACYTGNSPVGRDSEGRDRKRQTGWR